MSELTYYVYNTQFGPITISGNTTHVTGVFLQATSLSGTFRPTKVTNDCSTQLLEFFSGKRQKFAIPLLLQGSEFEKDVWRALYETDYASVVTPSEIAKRIGKPTAHRQVTSAAHANKIAVIIPNHRLVPASGFEKPSTALKQRIAIRKLEEKFSKQI